MRLLNLRINFYLLRTFCPHLGSFSDQEASSQNDSNKKTISNIHCLKAINLRIRQKKFFSRYLSCVNKIVTSSLLTRFIHGQLEHKKAGTFSQRYFYRSIYKKRSPIYIFATRQLTFVDFTSGCPIDKKYLKTIFDLSTSMRLTCF